jgi:tRNA(Ile)-lysidine synthase
VVGLVLQRIGQLNRHPRFTAVERVLAQVVDGKSGSYVTLPRVWVTREFSEIRFQIPAPKSNGPYPFITESQCVPIPSQVGWPLTGQTLEVSLEGDPPKEISGDPQHAWLDIHTFSASLVVRTWQSGDQFCPLGLGGQRKKLQDFFSDIKLERSKRSRVPLLVAPEGILWVGGYRLDHRFRMTESTKEVLMANLSPHTQFHFA